MSRYKHSITILVDKHNAKLLIFCKGKEQFMESNGKTWSRGTNSRLPLAVLKQDSEPL